MLVATKQVIINKYIINTLFLIFFFKEKKYD